MDDPKEVSGLDSLLGLNVVDIYTYNIIKTFHLAKQ